MRHPHQLRFDKEISNVSGWNLIVGIGVVVVLEVTWFFFVLRKKHILEE